MCGSAQNATNLQTSFIYLIVMNTILKIAAILMEDQTGVKPVLGHGNISHDITAHFSRETVPLNKGKTNEYWAQ